MKCVVNDVDGKIYYKKDYASDFTITVLDTRSKMIYRTDLQNAYPITMNAIDLSNADSNNLMRVTVTLTYDNYTTKSTNFNLSTSLHDILNSIQFPNPFMPGVPFFPFGDLGEQKDAFLAGLKAELAGELNSVLNSITSDIRSRITESATSITIPYQGTLGSIASQLTGSVTNLFGSAIKDALGKAEGKLAGAQATVSRASSAIKGLFG